MIYEICNPSDAMTIEADEDLVAALAGLYLGQGQVGITSAKGEDVLPIFIFGGDEALVAWLKTVGIDGIDGLKTTLMTRKDEIAACLESIAYGSITDRKGIMAVVEGKEHHERLEAMAKWNDAQRSSLNDYSTACFNLAKEIRLLTEDDIVEPEQAAGE